MLKVNDSDRKKPSHTEIELKGELISLFPAKFAFWKKESTIFLSDCHLGKISHFRKCGIGIPTQAGLETFSQIHKILLEFQPERIIFLGDIFHSDFNSDFHRFENWRKQFKETSFDLVLGNHDKSGLNYFEEMGLNIHPELTIGPFYCTHEPQIHSEKGFNFCGHIHPAVSLFGSGRQNVKVPCFWKGNNHLCFPSFGVFTGSVSIKPNSTDQFFALAGNSIRLIEGSSLL